MSKIGSSSGNFHVLITRKPRYLKTMLSTKSNQGYHDLPYDILDKNFFCAGQVNIFTKSNAAKNISTNYVSKTLNDFSRMNTFKGLNAVNRMNVFMCRVLFVG